ncbi:MAG: hypothetical protein JWP31_2012 [Aeromicrobium sp.]|nr:hypothetical protein [Aeromicrobium sp.]
MPRPRPGRVLIVAGDAAAGDGHARHDADEVTVHVVGDGESTLPDLSAYDQVLVVGFADPGRLAEVVTIALDAPGAPEVLVGGGASPAGAADDWMTALDGVGVRDLDAGPLPLVTVARPGAGAGAVVFGLLAGSTKSSPRLEAPPRDTPPIVRTGKSGRRDKNAAVVPSGWRGLVAGLRASPRRALAVGAAVTVVVLAVVATLAGLFGDAVTGAVSALVLLVVVTHAVRAEQRARSSRGSVRRLEKLVERQSSLLAIHSEELAALRTSTSVNELATVDIAKSLARKT